GNDAIERGDAVRGDHEQIIAEVEYVADLAAFEFFKAGQVQVEQRLGRHGAGPDLKFFVLGWHRFAAFSKTTGEHPQAARGSQDFTRRPGSGGAPVSDAAFSALDRAMPPDRRLALRWWLCQEAAPGSERSGRIIRESRV